MTFGAAVTVGVFLFLGLGLVAVAIAGAARILVETFTGLQKRHDEAIELMDLAAKALVEAHQTLNAQVDTNRRLMADLEVEHRKTTASVQELIGARRVFRPVHLN